MVSWASVMLLFGVRRWWFIIDEASSENEKVYIVFVALVNHPLDRPRNQGKTIWIPVNIGADHGEFESKGSFKRTFKQKQGIRSEK